MNIKMKIDMTIQRESRRIDAREKGYFNIIYCLKDLDTAFTQGLINEITGWHNEGYSIEEIAETINRDPDEIFIALFHQARQGKITKTFANRI